MDKKNFFAQKQPLKKACFEPVGRETAKPLAKLLTHALACGFCKRLKQMRFFPLGFFLLASLLVSCASEEPVLFSVHGTDSRLLAAGEAARAGALDFSRPAAMRFQFETPFAPRHFSSMAVEYSFSGSLSAEVIENFSLVLETSDFSWELPMDLSFLRVDAGENAVFHYIVPVNNAFNGRFSISLVHAAGVSAQNAAQMAGDLALQLHSVGFRERWFGFYPSERGGATHFSLSPFIFMNAEDALALEVPAQFTAVGIQPLVQIVHPSAALQAAQAAPVAFMPAVVPLAAPLAAPPAASPLDAPPPIPAAPLAILNWPQDTWRRAEWEVFRWERFPSIIIFDTLDYAVQERLFKRLAFYVEKRGFRGRLSHDWELEGLHGWNAHDYSAFHLAQFFDHARRINFPLLEEERFLERLLLSEGVIIDTGESIAPGEGAVLSISREAPPWLRPIFMAHEGFHGLFFIDEEFQEFTRDRWNQFSPAGQAFFIAYLEWMEYDTSYDFLLLKEFSGYILQQSVGAAAQYFGQTLPARIQNVSPYSASVPPVDPQTGSWPYLAQIFTAEAQAFSAYVSWRWGYAAGRVW